MSVHKKPPARARRTRLPKAERRERILEAALTAFERGGYHGTHVDDVIREADIARGTFYLYFPGKHEVFEALVDRMLGIFLEAQTDARPSRRSRRSPRRRRCCGPPITPCSRRCAAIAASVASSSRRPSASSKGSPSGWRGTIARGTTACGPRSTMFVEHGIARPALDTELTAEMVLGMVERLSRRYLFADRAPDLDRIVDAVVAMELRGILP